MCVMIGNKTFYILKNRYLFVVFRSFSKIQKIINENN